MTPIVFTLTLMEEILKNFIITTRVYDLCWCSYNSCELQLQDKTEDLELRDISEMILKFLYTLGHCQSKHQPLTDMKDIFAVYIEVGGFTYTSMHCYIHLFIMKRRMNTLTAGGVIFDETALFLIEYNLRGGTT